MTIKNGQIVPILEGISKLNELKLSGIILKAVLKNRKSLLSALEELEEVKKKLIEVNSVDGQLTEEGIVVANKEWAELSNADSAIELVKFNSDSIDLLSDLTLTQMEILELMSE